MAELLIAAILVLLPLNVGGCFVAAVQIESLKAKLDRSEFTDVSRYEEMRARVASRVPGVELEGFPEHVPPTSTETRMSAIFGKRHVGLLLYCKFMPGEARDIAGEARTRAVKMWRGMEKKWLERSLGVPMPDDLEVIAWIDTKKGVGLGGFSPKCYGTSAWLIVSEDSGTVIWHLLHYPPDLPPPVDSVSVP